MASVNTFNGVFPRPPTGKRSDYLPKRRPGTRYRRPNSLLPIEVTNEPESRVSESARSSSEREQQSRTESLNNGKETTAKTRTRRQNHEDISAVVPHTEEHTKKKHSSWVMNGGHPLPNADDDTCAIMMAKRLDETFNAECANQLIVERCKAPAAEVHVDVDSQCQFAAYTEKPDVDTTKEIELECEEKGSGDDETFVESKNKDSNGHNSVYSNGVGKATSTTSACISSKLTQRSVSVQVPDEDMNLEELKPHHKRVEIMIIDPVISGLYAAKSEESRFTNTTEIAFQDGDCDVGNLKTSSGLKTRMEGERNHPIPHASKPTDWDNVSVSAIVELEMMKEDLEEGIVENLEKLGRLLNLETRHNGKDHSAMECEVAALVSVLKEEMDASDDDEDDYHRMSDLDEEYDYWKINSGVLIWSPPLRADEKSGVVPHKKISQFPTLESIKEEDNGESDVDNDSEGNSESETEVGNEAKQVERGEHQLKDHAATGISLCSNPSKVVETTMPTCYTSQGIGAAVDGFADMLSSAIISNALSDRNKMQGSSSKMASVIVTSRESFGSSGSETMCEQKESATQSEPEIIATSLLQPASTSPLCTANQAVNSSDSQFSSLADSATSTSSTVTLLVPAESNTSNTSVILTSPSDENLGVSAEPSKKTEIYTYSAPILNCAPVRSCTADENERKISAPTLKSSAMRLKPLSSTCESTNISEEEIDDTDDNNDDDDDTSCKAVYHSSESEVSNDKHVASQTSMKKVRWSDLQFPSTDGSATTDSSATATGSTVTMLVPAESNTCSISVILTSPSNENLGVTVEPSENLEIHSAPTLNSSSTKSCPADERQIVSAPTLIPSAKQLEQLKPQENQSAKVAKSEVENDLVRGLIPSSVTASATFDGGDTIPADINRSDDDENEDMVNYSESGKEVCISPTTTNRELGLRSKNSTIKVAEENGTGKSLTRKGTLRKVKKSLAAFRSCDLKESNYRRSKDEKLERFRSTSEPPLEDCKIVLHCIGNPDRSIKELRRSSAGTTIIPEEFTKKKNPRDKQSRPSCDGTLVKRGSRKSASKAGKHVSSLSDTCARTCDGKTLKTSSNNPASDKYEAESVGKNKRRSNKNNPRSTMTAVSSANKKGVNVDASQSLISEVRVSNAKVTAKPSCKLEKSSHQLVSGTYDSVGESCQSKCSSGFLPKIPSYNYHKKSYFPLLSVANGLSVKQVSSEETLPSIASTGQITEERSPLKLSTIKSATIRGSNNTTKASHSAKQRQAVLKAKSSIGGLVLPSKNVIANGLEQKRADTLGMPMGHAKPNSSEASGKQASASMKVNQNFGAATLGHEMVLEQSTVQEMAKKASRSQSDKNHDKLLPLTQPETLSLPKIPLTSDGQGLDATAWIRANRDIILRHTSRKNVSDHHRKTGHSMSDNDKLPQIHLKRENQSLPQMLHRPPWY